MLPAAQTIGGKLNTVYSYLSSTRVVTIVGMGKTMPALERIKEVTILNAPESNKDCIVHCEKSSFVFESV